MTTLWQLFRDNPAGTVFGFGLLLLVYVLFVLPPVLAILYGFQFLLTLPMRRNERARLFLDLLELGLKDGRTPEAAIVEAAASRDTSIGVRFYLLARHIEKGDRLGQALERVPRLLPPQVRGMLNAGGQIGNIAKVLPACRQLLRDGVSQVRGAVNYLVILAFCVTPFTIFVPVYLNIFVIPKYREVFDSLIGGNLPAFSQLVLSRSRIFITAQCVVLCLVWLAMLAYVGGPRLYGWLRRMLPGAIDGLLWRLPWRRKRLQRDVSTILAVLLDSGMPEAQAVTLAAESTANAVVIRRATEVNALLKQGTALPDALRRLDDTNELHWRISNALRGSGGFLRSLKGWHEALDARAFQLEQSAAQIATTVFVLFNGFVVACFVIAVFLVLINLVNQAALW